MEGALCRKCANKASNVATTVSEFRQLLLTVKGVAPVVPFTFGQNQQHQFTFPEIALPPNKGRRICNPPDSCSCRSGQSSKGELSQGPIHNAIH